jgi:hypothetical protein
VSIIRLKYKILLRGMALYFYDSDYNFSQLMHSVSAYT